MTYAVDWALKTNYLYLSRRTHRPPRHVGCEQHCGSRPISVQLHGRHKPHFDIFVSVMKTFIIYNRLTEYITYDNCNGDHCFYYTPNPFRLVSKTAFLII